MSIPPRRLLLLGAFAALYLIWGSTYLATRIGVESWPPLLLGAIRFLPAGGLMYGFLRWRGVAAPRLAEWRAAALVGVLLIGCGNGGLSLAQHLGVASGVAALATATVPLFSLLFGLFWGQRQSVLEWAGIGLGLLGIGLLNLGGSLVLRLDLESPSALAARTDGQRHADALWRRGAAAGQRPQW